jgi:hypothetical protein
MCLKVGYISISSRHVRANRKAGCSHKEQPAFCCYDLINPVLRRRGFCLDNGFARAPPFIGNADATIITFLRVDFGRMTNQPVKFYVSFNFNDSPFRAALEADTAPETILVNFVSHFKLL